MRASTKIQREENPCSSLNTKQVCNKEIQGVGVLVECFMEGIIQKALCYLDAEMHPQLTKKSIKAICPWFPRPF